MMTAFSRRRRDRLEAAKVADTALGHRRAVPSHTPVVWGVERRLHLLVLHEAVVLRCHRPKQLDVRVRMLSPASGLGAHLRALQIRKAIETVGRSEGPLSRRPRVGSSTWTHLGKESTCQNPESSSTRIPPNESRRAAARAPRFPGRATRGGTRPRRGGARSRCSRSRRRPGSLS